jgi:hypothetical protein
MRKILKKLISDFSEGKNIDLVATIGFAFVISFLNLLGKAQSSLVASVTLAVLGLIAISLLVTRRRLERFGQFEECSNTVEFLDEKPLIIEKALSEADQISLMGLMLRGTTLDNYHSFLQRAEKGLKIRSIIVDPSEVDIQKIDQQFPRGSTSEQIRSQIGVVINQYLKLMESSKHKTDIELRLLPIIPPFSLYIFPNYKPHGIILVELYGYISRSGSIPKFLLSQDKHPHWYKFYCDQFETMWNDARKVEF